MLERMMNLHILLYCMAALGAMGAIGMLATNLTYRRMLKKNSQMESLKEKWLSLWKTRDKLLHRMNRMVWYPALLCTGLLGVSVAWAGRSDRLPGLPLAYLYVGAIVPVALLALRQGLDFSYKETLVMNALSDYVEKTRTWVEETQNPAKQDPVFQEEVVERITASIRQTAATGSHFSKMLSPEEEEIMREIIREFMTENGDRN